MRIFALAFIALVACAFAAEKNGFTLEAEKKLIAPGESIPIKVKIENMEGYKARAWYVLFFKTNVPEGAAEALGKKYSGKNPAWSFARIYEAWFAKDTLDQTERTITLKTSPKWLPGDYKVKIQMIFRQDPANTKTDKYVSKDLIFTIQPAEEKKAE